MNQDYKNGEQCERVALDMFGDLVRQGIGIPHNLHMLKSMPIAKYFVSERSIHIECHADSDGWCYSIDVLRVHEGDEDSKHWSKR